jgi:hypothetical protein
MEVMSGVVIGVVDWYGLIMIETIAVTITILLLRLRLAMFAR